MKSSLKNMVLVLLGICLVTSAAVALVYDVTKEPIEKAKQQKTVDALKAVLPTFDNQPQAEEGVYKATLGGQTVGYAVESTSPNGFNGNIKLMVGFDTEGTIVNIAVLEQAETPGLGSNMAEEDNVLLTSFKGKKASELKMTVKKDGGDVDALTAATISSRAYAEAVALAYEAFKKAKEADKPKVVIDYTALVPEYNQMFDGKVEGVKVRTAIKGASAVGYVIEGKSDNGYNGLVSLVVGFLPDGTIYGIAVAEQNETPGLGGEMTSADNVLAKSLVGKNGAKVKWGLKKEGGSVDALTAATISSRAYVEAVEAAYETFKKVVNQ